MTDDSREVRFQALKLALKIEESGDEEYDEHIQHEVRASAYAEQTCHLHRNLRLPHRDAAQKPDEGSGQRHARMPAAKYVSTRSKEQMRCDRYCYPLEEIHFSSFFKST